MSSGLRATEWRPALWCGWLGRWCVCMLHRGWVQAYRSWCMVYPGSSVIHAWPTAVPAAATGNALRRPSICLVARQPAMVARQPVTLCRRRLNASTVICYESRTKFTDRSKWMWSPPLAFHCLWIVLQISFYRSNRFHWLRRYNIHGVSKKRVYSDHSDVF